MDLDVVKSLPSSLSRPEIRDKFVEEVKKVVNEFYEGDVQKSPNYARMINERNFDRVSGLIDEKKVDRTIRTFKKTDF